MNREALRKNRERRRILAEMTPRERAIFSLREAGVEPTEHRVELRLLVGRMNSVRTLEEIEEVEREVDRWLEEHPEDDYVIGRNAELMYKVRLGLLARQEQEPTVPGRSPAMRRSAGRSAGR